MVTDTVRTPLRERSLAVSCVVAGCISVLVAAAVVLHGVRNPSQSLLAIASILVLAPAIGVAVMRWRGGRMAVTSLLFVSTFSMNAMLMPNEMLPSDPDGWFTEARVYVRTGNLAIPEGLASQFVHGLFIPNPSTGKLHCKYGIASTITVLPPVWLANRVSAEPALEFVIINIWQAAISGAVACLLFLIACRYTSRLWVAMVFAVACCYSTFLWFYIRAQGTEIYQLFFFLGWFASLTSERENRDGTASGVSPSRLAMAWVCVIMLLHTRPVFLLMLPATWALVCIPRFRFRSPPHPSNTIVSLWLILPSVLAFCSWTLSNHLRFGAWYWTGYHIPGNGGETADLGNLPSIATYVADPSFSVFVTFPILFFAIFGLKRFLRVQATAYFVTSGITFAIAVVAAVHGIVEGGWSEGPRYLLFALPILSLPCVSALDRLAGAPLVWTRVFGLASLLSVLLLSSFVWWQTVSRPMFAWYRISQIPYPIFDAQACRYLMKNNRGMILKNLWDSRYSLDEHPYMAHVRNAMPTDKYVMYREMVQYYSSPIGFIILRPPAPSYLPAKADSQ